MVRYGPLLLALSLLQQPVAAAAQALTLAPLPEAGLPPLAATAEAPAAVAALASEAAFAPSLSPLAARAVELQALPERLRALPPETALLASDRLFDARLARRGSAVAVEGLASASEAAPLGTLRRQAFGVGRVLLSPAVHAVYRVRVRGKLPAWPSIIVSNHVSYLDAAMIAFAAERPVRFLMRRDLYESRWSGWLFRLMGAIPISHRDSPDQIRQSLQMAREALLRGETVAIFPEGRLTRNGNLSRFRRGFERIADITPVPVVPVHVDGLWGSVFSQRAGLSLAARLRQILRQRTFVRFGEPLRDPTVQAAREAVQQLGAESAGERISETAKTLPRAFVDSAKRHWGRLALADTTGQELTYGKALTGAVLIGSALRPRIKGGEHVGVLLPPSAGGALANIALGAIGRVPVNLNYTASRDAFLHAAEKTKLETIVTSRVFLERLEKELGWTPPPGPYELIYLEDLRKLITDGQRKRTYLALKLLPAWAVERIYFRDAARHLDAPATVLFTTGSSSMPKGVVLTHHNIQSNLAMVRAVFETRKDDVVLGTLPIFHSFGFTVTLWLPVLSGMLAAYHNHPLQPAPIAQLAQKYGATMLLGMPRMLKLYARAVPREAFSKLRLAMAGAAKLRQDAADAFEKAFGLKPLEGYGMTEASPVVSANVRDVGGQLGNKPGTVGHPLPGVAVKVLDVETGEPLPFGRAGMLYVKGPNVMPGYLDEPEKTAKALSDGWYRSGDIASVDEDGFIKIEDRIERFSKILGEMVSHVEVEDKLHAAAGVDEKFFVTAVPDANRDERLVVLYADWDGDVQALLAKARAAGLSKISTPDARDFFRVDKLPETGTGKPDLGAAKKLALQFTGPKGV